MSVPDLGVLRGRFLDYAESFIAADPGQDAHYRLKTGHTLRVLTLAQEIAREERMDPDTADLTAMAALFHDTGRYRQIQKYRTFVDRVSENHARLGVRALLADGLLAGLPPARRGVVLGAVFLHNVRSLPERLPPVLRAVTMAVRDADKLDIVPVLLEHLETAPELDPVICMNVTRAPGRYTPEILDDLEQGRTAEYSRLRFENDMRLLVASWIYDLNYPAARRIYARRGLLERVLAPLPDDERLQSLRRRLEQALGPA